MEIKEYVVILKKGIDYNQIWADIENPTTGLPHIPDRPINIVDSLNAFERLCTYALTDEEAEKLRQDPRVQAVEIPIEQMPGVEVGHFATQNPSTLTPPGNFNKPSGSSNTSVNWGLIRHSNNSNVYGSNLNTSLNYNYVLDGTGVDVVISDTGIQADHPEFTDANGISRVQQINWATYVPALSTMTANPYVDPIGHGTHVAGIAAGKTYGWAKNARIYVFPAAVTGAPDPRNQFAAIKLWHTSKNGSRPTVVNMSWGYRRQWQVLGNSSVPSTALNNFILNININKMTYIT
jgi:subtilisin family serine protease